MSEYYEFDAIKVTQPFSDYYICSIPSDILRKISFSLKAVNNQGQVQGVQRTLNPQRLKEIGQFIDSDSAAFPNPIILGANFKETGRLADEDERVVFTQVNGGMYKVRVPKTSQVLSIIDGQHRLYGFEYANSEMELSCSIYEDLAMPFQAFLFSTINYTQGKVDKSLAYQLFGYEIESSKPIQWPPETLAVYFVRKLNQLEPLLNRVKYRTADEKKLSKEDRDKLPSWRFSTSSIVESILSLISHNPKQDRYLMNTKSIEDGSEIVGRSVLKDDERYPLRAMYISGNDKAIEDVLTMALKSTDTVFWQHVGKENFLKKTVGIACIFKFLKAVLEKHGVSKKTMEENFPEYLEKIAAVEKFSDENKYPSSTKGLNAAYNKMLELAQLS